MFRVRNRVRVRIRRNGFRWNGIRRNGAEPQISHIIIADKFRQAKNNKRSWPSFCSWNSLPSSYGKCPRLLLLSNSSLSDTISPSSGGSECSLLVDTSRWIKLDRWATSAGRLTSWLLRRYSFVRWPKCHSDGLRFVMPPVKHLLTNLRN